MTTPFKTDRERSSFAIGTCLASALWCVLFMVILGLHRLAGWA